MTTSGLSMMIRWPLFDELLAVSDFAKGIKKN